MAFMAKTLAIILGLILVLLGLLGFTSNPLIGANSLFATDMVHNLIHIVFGAVLLIVAFWSGKDSVLWLKIVGAVVFLLGIIGILSVPTVGGMLLGIAYTNGTSNWLHLIAGIVIFIAGVYGKDSAAGGVSSTQSPTQQDLMQ
jgi:hypothetical protein